ncbi:hypothetical protein MTO96_052139 [Rhipicephalus appendiculatus]
MKLKPGSVGTVVPARRVPVALQDRVLAELQRMEQQGVITKVIRLQQKVCYDRNARYLRPLKPGQHVTTYDTLQRTWSPAVVLRPAEAPRSMIVKTEDGREMRRTREHLREAAPEPGPESTSPRASEDSGFHGYWTAAATSKYKATSRTLSIPVTRSNVETASTLKGRCSQIVLSS